MATLSHGLTSVIHLATNSSKAGDWKSLVWARFYLPLGFLGVNLPKVGDSKNLTWSRFCLTLRIFRC